MRHENDRRTIIDHDNGSRRFVFVDPKSGEVHRTLTVILQQGPAYPIYSEEPKSTRAPRRSLLEVLGSTRLPIVNALFRRSSK